MGASASEGGQSPSALQDAADGTGSGRADMKKSFGEEVALKVGLRE